MDFTNTTTNVIQNVPRDIIEMLPITPVIPATIPALIVKPRNIHAQVAQI